MEVIYILLFLILLFSLFFLFLELLGINRVASKVFSIFPMVLLFITFSFNRSYTADYIDYKYGFATGYDIKLFDFGFVYFSRLLKYMGLEFESIIFISGILLMFVIYKYTKTSRYTNLVVAMYSISLLIINVTQIRNTIMYLIILLSLIYIKDKKIFKHYLLMFVAFSMHKFALVYTPFYYLCMKTRKQFISLMVRIFIIISVATPVIMKFLVWLFPVKLTIYLERKPGLGILIVFVYVFLDLLTIWWIDRKVNNKLDEKENAMAEILFRFIFYSVVSLPFTFYFLEVKRMQRNAMLAKFFYSTITLHHMKFVDRFIVVTLLIISAVLPIIVMHYNNELSKFLMLDRNCILEFFGIY